MKFVMDSFMDQGTSIKRNLFRKRNDQIKELVMNLSFEKYNYFNLRLVVTGDIEKITQIGIKENTYIVEYRYPVEKFRKVLLKEKNNFLTELVVNALVSFYKAHDKSPEELFILRDKYIR